MRLAHVVATVDEQTAGPSHSVTHLCRALAGHADLSLHTVAGWRGAVAVASAPYLHRHPQDFANVPVAKSLCLSSGLYGALKAEAAAGDVIHTHGLWLMPNIYPAWAARGSPCATVISPRGMLGAAALAFSSVKKAALWRLMQKAAVDSAHCLHATSESEFDEIRAFGVKTPVAIIPNGVLVPAAPSPVLEKKVRTVLSLGRIHPKKNLAALIRAWAQVEGGRPDWRLRIAGPSELGHAEELSALARQLGLERVAIEGPLLGDAKAQAYGDADIFVLPTLNENFALTVAEALAAGTPVIATKGAPWSGLNTEGCGWWIDIGAEPMAAALNQAMDMPHEALEAMGAKGHAWMARSFSWEAVAAEMTSVYRWICGQADAPDCVRLA